MSDAQLKAKLKQLFDQINYKELEAREIQRKSSPITGRRSFGAYLSADLVFAGFAKRSPRDTG